MERKFRTYRTTSILISLLVASFGVQTGKFVNKQLISNYRLDESTAANGAESFVGTDPPIGSIVFKSSSTLCLPKSLSH